MRCLGCGKKCNVFICSGCTADTGVTVDPEDDLVIVEGVLEELEPSSFEDVAAILQIIGE